MVTRQSQGMLKRCKLRRCGGGEGGGALCSDPNEDELKTDTDVKYNPYVPYTVSVLHTFRHTNI